MERERALLAALTATKRCELHADTLALRDDHRILARLASERQT